MDMNLIYNSAQIKMSMDNLDGEFSQHANDTKIVSNLMDMNCNELAVFQNRTIPTASEVLLSEEKSGKSTSVEATHSANGR
jgi:hypothetical protein